jgi:uncharacterized protein YkwD
MKTPRYPLAWLVIFAILLFPGSIALASPALQLPSTPAPLLPTPLPLYSGCGGVASPPVSNAEYEQRLVELVNQARLNNGSLPPLKRTSSLDQASRYHAIDMAQDSYFEHNTYDRNTHGQLVFVCNWDTRILTYYSNPWALAENIAAGQTTPEQAMNSWMGSSGHRANILDTNNWEIGVGYYSGGPWGHYWVQDFGQREGVYPLVINREDDLTFFANVTIYIYGSWSEMRLRNDNGAWGGWQTFQNQFSWTLQNQGGMRSVSAELRAGATTASTSDTIFLVDTSSQTEHSYIPLILK